MDSIRIPGISSSSKVTKYLKYKDPCFGKYYEKNNITCNECQCPVIVNESIFLMNELCANLTEGEEPTNVRNITSREVLDYIKKGVEVNNIIVKMIDGTPTNKSIKKARDILANRISYLKNKKGIPTPNIPTSEELINEQE